MRTHAALVVFALSCTAALADENTTQKTARERELARDAHACEAGDVVTCLRLGTTYANGISDEVARDARRARRFYERAAEIDEPACAAGDPETCERLASTYLSYLKDRRRAMAVWRSRCQAGVTHACSALAEIEAHGGFGVAGTIGARWGQPQGWSGSVTLIFGEHDQWSGCDNCATLSLPGYSGRGFLLQLEPGVAGGKISAGWGDSSTIVPPFTSGLAIKASYLRGWSDTGRLASGNDYVGVETDWALIGLKASVGLYKGVGRDRGPLFAWGVGVGF